MPKKVVGKSKETNSFSIQNELSNQVPVVGIGTSAGGLEAMDRFFSNMPSNTGLAFVVVQHLDPDHVSILTDLIRRYTKMKVCQIEDGVEIKKNTIYIIPPGFEVKLIKNKLMLGTQSVPRGLRLPIDTFFKSLAQDKKDKAIAVILSGTGTDGTLGIRAIKAENGFIFVQSPENAHYDGMPISAISTGIVDYILDADKIPGKLLAYIQYILDNTGKIPVPEEYSMTFVLKIYHLLRARTGHDFSGYKPQTIIRRIERRMKIVEYAKIEDYYLFLQKDNSELDLLFKDFLIGVTNFFRDKDAFDALYKNIIPALFVNRNEEIPIRIWTPGCSTGEEAFSIGILFKEYMNVHKLNNFKVQIFATDIDSIAVEKARLAMYPESISKDVPADLIQKYFAKSQNAYRVNKSVRDMIVFAEQSLVKDPPFSKVDLIVCRNLLIYISNELQEKITTTFHYALNSNGYLFLGSSESLGKNSDLFIPKDKKWKFFQKKNSASNNMFISSLPSFYPSFKERIEPLKLEVQNEKSSLKLLVEGKILEKFTPAAVLVNTKFDILYLQGKTTSYLEPVQGIANLNLLQMAKSDIRIKLNVALNKSLRDHVAVIEEKLHIKTDGTYKYINIHILPVAFEADLPTLFLVAFEDITEKEVIQNSVIQEYSENDMGYIADLEEELKRTKDYLQVVIEQAETTNEELKATNEELQSSNEELQSTNEELETSKEELQSINEELITVNTEHQYKIIELSEVNNDVSNYLSSTGIATIFLDLQLKIKKFTPRVADFFHLLASDIDRPIESFSTKLNYPTFQTDILKVVNTLNTVEKEIESNDRSYFIRITPYRTLDNVVEGVVITFNDISMTKKYVQEIEQNEERYRQMFKNSPYAVVIHDYEMNIVDVNKKAIEEFGYSKTEFLEKSVLELYPAQELPKSKKILGVVNGKNALKTEVKFLKKDGTIFMAEAMPCTYIIHEKPIIHMVIRNITKEKEAEIALRLSEEKFKKAFDFASIGFAIISLKGNWISVNNSVCEMLGYTEEELYQKTFQEITHPEDLEKDMVYVKEMLENKRETYQTEKRYIHSNGAIIWGLLSVFLVSNAKGKPLYFISQIVNISDQKKSQTKLEQWTHLFEHSQCGILIGSTDIKTIETMNLAIAKMYGYNAISEIEGKPFDVLISPQYREDFIQNSERANKIGYHEWRSVHNRKDGTEFPVLIIATAVKDNQSGILYRIINVKDLTSQDN